MNHLKIAQSFINRSTSDPEQQRDLLTSTNAKTQAQGFHFSKAVGADRAGELLREGRVASVIDSSAEEGPLMANAG